MTAREGLPICERASLPPLFGKIFFSDAAGANFAISNGRRVNLNTEGDRGVACVEIMDEKVAWWAEISWPRHFLEEAVDGKGAHYGSKTTTLEAIGGASSLSVHARATSGTAPGLYSRQYCCGIWLGQQVCQIR
jgi:hypothetical protein